MVGKKGDVRVNDRHIRLLVWHLAHGWEWNVIDLTAGALGSGMGISEADASQQARQCVGEAVRGNYMIVWTDWKNTHFR